MLSDSWQTRRPLRLRKFLPSTRSIVIAQVDGFAVALWCAVSALQDLRPLDNQVGLGGGESAIPTARRKSGAVV